MNRYLGLYRPWGYKKNVYIVFQTANPQYHFMTLRKIYTTPEFEEMCEIGYLHGGPQFTTIPKSEVDYSKKSYSDYKLKFDQLLNKLEKDGNIVNKKTSQSNIKRWPTVELSDINFDDGLPYFKKLYEHLE